MNFPMIIPGRIDVGITSIHWKPNFNKFPSVLFRYNFVDQKINVASTCLFGRNLDGQKIHAVSKYFLVWNIEKSKFIPLSFLDVILLIKISKFFLRTFFDVILMVEKSTLFPRTFFSKISWGRNLASLIVKLRANKNIQEGFLFLVTLKKLPFAKLFPLNFFK